MLKTKTVLIKWNSRIKKWYESRGYVFTKMEDEFEAKVEDLTDGSHALVDIQCDGCGEILKDIIWQNYKNNTKKSEKYYCKKCSNVLFALERTKKTKLKNSKSFYQWCYENLSKEEADKLLSRWDYIKNTKNGKVLTPKDVLYSSHGFNRKGYWFKCLDHPEHESEMKYINAFTGGQKGSLDCDMCNMVNVTHPYLTEYLVNKEDALNYTMGSNTNILMKCPNCNFQKEMNFNRLATQGFSCPQCSDGIPYPEKFMFNVLEQLLDKDFKTQLTKTTFDWCRNYRYDFYIPLINSIIETHGLQHYEELNNKWQSLNKTQKNDKIKELTAKENGIDNYIIINCKYSEMNWIKNSIMNSEPSLPKLLNFKEEDIDWLKCHEYACSSIVKEVCGLWNNGMESTLDISKLLRLGRTTVRRYLKQGVELGWCDYDPQIEKEKKSFLLKEKYSKKIICLTTGEIFNSISEAGVKYNIEITSICACCSSKNKQKSAGKHPETKEKLIWMYYDDTKE